MIGESLLNLNRYKGQIVLPEISIEGQRKLEKSSVAIVGVGGTGSLAAEYFSRMGIGHITLIDGDVCREQDLHRQSLYSEADLGRPKVESAKRRLETENSEFRLNVFNTFLDDKNSDSLLHGSDLVYDGTDNVMARHSINRYSIRNEIPWVMVSAIEYYGQVKGVIPGKTSCLTCIGYPENEEAISCSEQGIFPPILLWVSSIGIATAMDVLLGKEISGDFINIDLKTMEMKRIRAEKNGNCKLCSHL